MPRSWSGRSDGSDGEMETLAEGELSKLQRQYRIMENDRNAYTEESQNMLRKQSSEVSALEKEKEGLLKELRLAESRSNQSKDDINTDILITLAEAKDDRDNEIEEEKKKGAELNMQIRDWERKIRQKQKSTGGSGASGQHTAQTRKEFRTQENRLDQALKKFNTCLTNNKQLREEIESLRVERNRFDGLYRKREKELLQLRREIGEVIENSTGAYDARDEAQAKIMLLREKADKDVQQHNAEMKELVRIIDHDRKLKEFMGIKGQERKDDPQLVAWRQRKEALESEKKKESQEDSVETYEIAIQRIRAMTDEEDLDIMVNHFIENEDRNFALFNYINEQNNEIEFLQDQMDNIKNEIENFKFHGIELETQRKIILKQLEDRQNKASEEGDEYEEKQKEVSKILDQLRAGIDSLFNKINCDRSVIDDMLGATSGVNNSNMIQYLGIVEQRTNELLGIQAYCNSKDYEKYDPKAPGLLGEGPKPPTQQLQIALPTIGDEYESEGTDTSDEESHPFTRAELQNKVMKTVKRRESAIRRDGFKYDLSNAREKTQKQKGKK